MLRGRTWFICPECGRIFKALDIEDSATVYSVPMPCPDCGAKSYRLGLRGVVQFFRSCRQGNK